MYQQFYTHSTLLALPLVAMALFMGTYAVVVFRALRRRDVQREQHLSALPLDNDEPRAREGEHHA